MIEISEMMGTGTIADISGVINAMGNVGEQTAAILIPVVTSIWGVLLPILMLVFKFFFIMEPMYILSESTNLFNYKHDYKKAKKCIENGRYTQMYPKDRCEGIVKKYPDYIKESRTEKWKHIRRETIIILIIAIEQGWIPIANLWK